MYILAFDVGGTKIEAGLLHFTSNESENDLYWSYKKNTSKFFIEKEFLQKEKKVTNTFLKRLPCLVRKSVVKQLLK